MARSDPLPFRLPVPDRDTVDGEGAQSISYRVEGFLHLGEDVLTLEWTGVERTQQVSFFRIRDQVDPLPVEWAEIPMAWITEARLRGGWWRPHVELRARRLDAFEGIPTARPGALYLRIRRRDRMHAAQIVTEIQRAGARAATLAREDPSRVSGHDGLPLESGHHDESGPY